MFLTISRKLALVSTISLLGLFVMFVLANELVHDNELELEIQKSIRHAKFMMDEQEKQESMTLATALMVFMDDNEAKKIFASGNRDFLYKRLKSLFDDLEKRYGITHFYFHTTDGHNFLRLHNRDIHGDRIERITFRKAARDKKISSGIELGKTAFALRVVAPYYDGERLLGYVELGKEIDSFLDIFKKNTDNEFAIIADKRHLSREDWASVRKVAGLRDNWDDLTNYVWISKPVELPGAQTCFKEKNISLFISGPALVEGFPMEEYGHTCGGFPILDAGGNNVGVVMSLFDVAGQIRESGRHRYFALAIFLGFALLTGFVYTFMGRRITASIDRLRRGMEIVAAGDLEHKVMIEGNDEISALSRTFDDMVLKRKQAEEMLRGHSELVALYEVSSAINQSIEVEELFPIILKTITRLEVLEVEEKGGIFLVEGTEMKLISHLGHEEKFIRLHKGLRVGECLCGAAAATGELVISEDADKDPRHTIRVDEPEGHGNICIPLNNKGVVIGVLYLYTKPGFRLTEDRKKLLTSIGNHVGVVMTNAMLFEQTRQLTLSDPLTGLGNRRYFDILLAKSLSEAERYNKALSVVMLDIDYFKKYNDTYGHIAGDRLLVELARVLESCIRSADVAIRYGGEEFLLLLPNTGDITAQTVAERVRATVEKDTGVTVSAGIASYTEGVNPGTSLVKKADEALYRAKLNGRNRIEGGAVGTAGVNNL